MPIAIKTAKFIADSVIAASPLVKVEATAKETLEKSFTDLMQREYAAPVGLEAAVAKAHEELSALDPNHQFHVVPRMMGRQNFSLYECHNYLTQVRTTELIPTSHTSIQLYVQKPHHREVFTLYKAYQAAKQAVAHAHESLVDHIRLSKSIKALIADMPELKAHLPEAEANTLPALLDSDLKKKLGLTA